MTPGALRLEPASSAPVTFARVSHDPKVLAMVDGANEVMMAMGYTEHGRRHVREVSRMTGLILEGLGYEPREVELGRIAAFLHDIGNSISRTYHPLTGANLAHVVLTEMQMPIEEILPILGAIGNHEEMSGQPISALSAAVIIADKSDVHYQRVQNPIIESFDIHDRVNHAVQESRLEVFPDRGVIELTLRINTAEATLMEYFEIFLQRMVMCRLSAARLGVKFALNVNGSYLEGA